MAKRSYGITDINPNLLIAGGVTVGAFFFGKKLLQLLGLAKDKDDKSEDQFAKASYWDQKFVLNAPNGTSLLTAAQGKNLAEQLWDAAGFWNDNEEKIYDVFRKLTTQSQATSLVYWFSKYKQQDLYYWLSDVLGQGELLNIKRILDAKPKYKAGGVNGIGSMPKHAESIYAVVYDNANGKRAVYSYAGSKKGAQGVVNHVRNKYPASNPRVKKMYGHS